MRTRWALKLAILQSGKTQRQLGLELGIPETRFSEIVRGWTAPRAAERTSLAMAVGKSPAEVFPDEIELQDAGHRAQHAAGG